MEISEQLVVSLAVAESTMEDAGQYAVRVYNEYGEVTSTTQVNILFEAPTFTVPLTDQPVCYTIITGRQHSLLCKPCTSHRRDVCLSVCPSHAGTE